MGKRVAVVLAGCGVYDGSEIHEAVLTLLALDRAAAEVSCFAPNIQQLHVINHLTGEPEPGATRNVLTESARIARGAVADIAIADIHQFDAVVVPGGFGAAKNLCDFALSGSELTVQSDVEAFLQAAHQRRLPIGLICIAPAMTGRLFAAGALCTIGDDAETAAAIEATGARHQRCAVDEVCVDATNRLITTPAYMLAQSIGEAATGIDKLVDTLLQMA